MVRRANDDTKDEQYSCFCTDDCKSPSDKETNQNVNNKSYSCKENCQERCNDEKVSEESEESPGDDSLYTCKPSDKSRKDPKETKSTSGSCCKDCAEPCKDSKKKKGGDNNTYSCKGDCLDPCPGNRKEPGEQGTGNCFCNKKHKGSNDSEDEQDTRGNKSKTSNDDSDSSRDDGSRDQGTKKKNDSKKGKANENSKDKGKSKGQDTVSCSCGESCRKAKEDGKNNSKDDDSGSCAQDCKKKCKDNEKSKGQDTVSCSCSDSCKKDKDDGKKNGDGGDSNAGSCAKDCKKKCKDNGKSKGQDTVSCSCSDSCKKDKDDGKKNGDGGDSNAGSCAKDCKKECKNGGKSKDQEDGSEENKAAKKGDKQGRRPCEVCESRKKKDLSYQDYLDGASTGNADSTETPCLQGFPTVNEIYGPTIDDAILNILSAIKGDDTEEADSGNEGETSDNGSRDKSKGNEGDKDSEQKGKKKKDSDGKKSDADRKEKSDGESDSNKKGKRDKKKKKKKKKKKRERTCHDGTCPYASKSDDGGGRQSAKKKPSKKNDSDKGDGKDKDTKNGSKSSKENNRSNKNGDSDAKKSGGDKGDKQSCNDQSCNQKAENGDSETTFAFRDIFAPTGDEALLAAMSKLWSLFLPNEDNGTADDNESDKPDSKPPKRKNKKKKGDDDDDDNVKNKSKESNCSCTRNSPKEEAPPKEPNRDPEPIQEDNDEPMDDVVEEIDRSFDTVDKVSYNETTWEDETFRVDESDVNKFSPQAGEGPVDIVKWLHNEYLSLGQDIEDLSGELNTDEGIADRIQNIKEREDNLDALGDLLMTKHVIEERGKEHRRSRSASSYHEATEDSMGVVPTVVEIPPEKSNLEGRTTSIRWDEAQPDEEELSRMLATRASMSQHRQSVAIRPKGRKVKATQLTVTEPDRDSLMSRDNPRLTWVADTDSLDSDSRPGGGNAHRSTSSVLFRPQFEEDSSRYPRDGRGHNRARRTVGSHIGDDVRRSRSRQLGGSMQRSRRISEKDVVDDALPSNQRVNWYSQKQEHHFKPSTSGSLSGRADDVRPSFYKAELSQKRNISREGSHKSNLSKSRCKTAHRRKSLHVIEEEGVDDVWSSRLHGNVPLTSRFVHKIPTPRHQHKITKTRTMTESQLDLIPNSSSSEDSKSARDSLSSSSMSLVVYQFARNTPAVFERDYDQSNEKMFPGNAVDESVRPGILKGARKIGRKSKFQDGIEHDLDKFDSRREQTQSIDYQNNNCKRPQIQIMVNKSEADCSGFKLAILSLNNASSKLKTLWKTDAPSEYFKSSSFVNEKGISSDPSESVLFNKESDEFDDTETQFDEKYFPSNEKVDARELDPHQPMQTNKPSSFPAQKDVQERKSKEPTSFSQTQDPLEVLFPPKENNNFRPLESIAESNDEITPCSSSTCAEMSSSTAHSSIPFFSTIETQTSADIVSAAERDFKVAVRKSALKKVSLSGILKDPCKISISTQFPSKKTFGMRNKAASLTSTKSSRHDMACKCVGTSSSEVNKANVKMRNKDEEILQTSTKSGRRQDMACKCVGTSSPEVNKENVKMQNKHKKKLQTSKQSGSRHDMACTCVGTSSSEVNKANVKMRNKDKKNLQTSTKSGSRHDMACKCVGTSSSEVNKANVKMQNKDKEILQTSTKSGSRQDMACKCVGTSSPEVNKENVKMMNEDKENVQTKENEKLHSHEPFLPKRRYKDHTADDSERKRSPPNESSRTSQFQNSPKRKGSVHFPFLEAHPIWKRCFPYLSEKAAGRRERILNIQGNSPHFKSSVSQVGKNRDDKKETRRNVSRETRYVNDSKNNQNEKGLSTDEVSYRKGGLKGYGQGKKATIPSTSRVEINTDGSGRATVEWGPSEVDSDTDTDGKPGKPGKPKKTKNPKDEEKKLSIRWGLVHIQEYNDGSKVYTFSNTVPRKPKFAKSDLHMVFVVPPSGPTQQKLPEERWEPPKTKDENMTES